MSAFELSYHEPGIEKVLLGSPKKMWPKWYNISGAVHEGLADTTGELIAHPCPHHIDYEADNHTEDLGPPDTHFCLNSLREEVPCSPLPHTFPGGAPTCRRFFEMHQWG